jgi:DNA-binding MarR family transcriptional regulator
LTHDEHAFTPEGIRHLLYRRDVAITRHRTAVARTLGINDAEMHALVHLAAQSQMPPSVIAALLGLSSGGATALVQRLERGGHVKRSSHPTDRRKVLIRLSERTAARLLEAEVPFNEGLESTTQALNEAERAAVETVLTRIAALSEELAASMQRGAEPVPDGLTHPVPSLWA